jgi:hypothetical protein
MKPHPKRRPRGNAPNVPDDAKCLNCLGSGELFYTEGAALGKRLFRTVVCPECQGRGIRAIPLRDLK